ncbi:MAG: T9SS type A sorting domain-containing protein [Bacteroidales bacterium]|jgi:hypothetical protein|nr:T9SS type A sorting domain-containing protein [Bacteroidales bacterium]
MKKISLRFTWHQEIFPVVLVLMLSSSSPSGIFAQAPFTIPSHSDSEPGGVIGSPLSANNQEYLVTRDPKTGDIPLEKLWKAREYAQSLRNGDATSSSDIVWEERGPSNVGGRTRTLMFDPNDATHKKVWAGSVSGGLWFTNDITADPPTWHKVDDFWERLPVGCMAYDPTNTNIFYVGTGEGWIDSRTLRGAGIMKSEDGGNTWDTLTGTFFTDDFRHVQDIVVHPVTGYVYAATRGKNPANNGGILRSTDKGAHWTMVLNRSTAPTASRSNIGADLEIGTDNKIYATMGIWETGGIYRSTTGNPGNWTNIETGIDIMATRRIELAVSASSPNVLYCVAQDTTGKEDIQGIYKSTNSGGSWTAVSIPMRNATTSFATGQASYDLILAVHPTNPDLVYAGGVKMFRSTNSGTSWEQINEIHDDHHMIISRPGYAGEMVFGNDGGVFRTADCTANPPVVLNKNNGYNVTQFYTVAYHPNTSFEYFLGGTQDNGTPRFESPGINITTEANNGDGAYCHISQENPRYQITARQWNTYYRSTDYGATFEKIAKGKVNYWLIPPAVYDDAGDVLYSCYNADSLMRVRNFMGSYIVDYLDTLNMGDYISAILMHPYVPNMVVIGTYAGRIFKLENANSEGDWNLFEMNTAGLPGGSISAIEYGSSSSQCLVVFSNYGIQSVWETTDGGTTWKNKEGNLPDMPVRSAIYNPYDYKQVLLGTEVGVWTTEDITVSDPVWVPCNGGLANVRVNQLALRKSDMKIYAATFGRGIFTSSSLNAIPFQKLTASDATDSLRLGISVDLFGNYAIAGAVGFNHYQGAAYIFKFNGNEWVQTAKLTATQGAEGENFGVRVALYGDVAVVGAVYDDDNGYNAGAAYVFKRSGETWTQQTKLMASDGTSGDRFGAGIEIQGDYIAIGAAGHDPDGQVYIFKWNGSNWAQTCKIPADPASLGTFGISLAMVQDTLAIGDDGVGNDDGCFNIYVRSGEDWIFNQKFSGGFGSEASLGVDVALEQGTYVGGAPNYDNSASENSGGVFIYKRNSGGWTFYAPVFPPDSWNLYGTGSDVGIYGDYIIAGSPHDWSNCLEGGTASIYKRTDGHWNFLMKLYPEDTDLYDWFGSDVALNSQYAMVGAYGDDNEHGNMAGAVYFYLNYAGGQIQPDLSVVPKKRDVRSSASTAEFNVYNLGSGTMQWTATANDPWLTITSGSSGIDDGMIRVSFAGNDYCQRVGTITVEAGGALHSPQLLEISQLATGAQEEKKIVPADLTTLDYFGTSVAVDGTVAIIGDYGDDDKAPDAGVAYIYEFDGAQWTRKAKLTAGDAAAGDFFGWDVSLSGSIALVGAYNKNGGKGAVYVFVKPATGWQDMSQTARLTASDGTGGDNFGKSVSISGDYVVIASPGHSQGRGAVYFFDCPFTGWQDMTETVQLVGHDAAAGDNFASDVAISCEYAVTGSSNDDGKGSVYLFHRAWVWSEMAKFTASDRESGDGFGCSVDIWGDKVIAGAYHDDSDKGSAYVFLRPATGWHNMTETCKLVANDRANNDQFGYAVGIHEHNALVGARYDDDKGSASGSAYGFIVNDTTSWLEEKIVATDGMANDHFGQAVDLSYQYSIIGAPGCDDMGSSSGASYIYCNSCDTACTPEMTLDPGGTIDIPETPGTHTVNISNNGNCTMNWRSVTTASWLTIVSDTSGSNTGSINLQYTANPGNARTAILTVSSNDAFNAPLTVTYQQAHGPDIIIDSDSVSSGEVCWFASNSVTIPQAGGHYVIDGPATVNIVAGQRVFVEPGFQSNSGSNTYIYISETPCPSTSAPLEPGDKKPFDSARQNLVQENFLVPAFTLYPNPASEQINLVFHPSTHGSVVSVEIYNVMGDLIRYEQTTLTYPVKIQVKDIPPGIYLIRAKTDTQPWNARKVIIQ